MGSLKDNRLSPFITGFVENVEEKGTHLPPFQGQFCKTQ
jgi:hypothetical protein